MKKRLLLLPLFIIFLVVVISAPTHNSQDYRTSDIKYTFEKNNVETNRVFLIKNDIGPDYYRTFKNFNKARLNHGNNYPSNNQRGVYRDFFDVDKKEDHDCNIDCPAEWDCTKDSS